MRSAEDKIEMVAAVLYECSTYIGGWSFVSDNERIEWRAKAKETLTKYDLLYRSLRQSSNDGGILYVYHIHGQDHRVASGTHSDAMIYLSMLRAIYGNVSFETITDDGRFALRLADVCVSNEANDALDPGWLG